MNTQKYSAAREDDLETGPTNVPWKSNSKVFWNLAARESRVSWTMERIVGRIQRKAEEKEELEWPFEHSTTL